MSKDSFIRQMFSEKGVASSKRVLGGICLLVCLAVVVHLALTEGATEHVTNLLEVMIGFSAGLIGVSSITGAFKKGGSDGIE